MTDMKNDSSGLTCFEILAQRLLGLGLAEEAKSLSGAVTSVYTTSSEMYGEIGLEIRRIHGVVPVAAARELRAEFKACVKSVRTAWPEFTLESRPGS